jgi:multisubunit Na+/H+ antiporter MnhC subunit
VYGNEFFIEQTTPSWQPEVALKLKAVGEVAYDKSQSQEAMQWIRSNPDAFAHLVGLRIFHFWFPMGRNLMHTALEWSLTVLAMIGLYLLYFRHRAAALLILAMWLLYPPVYYIVLWSSRYRYPLNWTLILTAAVAVEFAISAVTGRRNPAPRGAL